MAHTIEAFRKELQTWCRSLGANVSIRDTGATFYLSDDLAVSAPLVIDIRSRDSIVVLVRRRGLDSLLADGRTVWVLDLERRTVEIFESGTSRTCTVSEALAWLAAKAGL